MILLSLYPEITYEHHYPGIIPGMMLVYITPDILPDLLLLVCFQSEQNIVFYLLYTYSFLRFKFVLSGKFKSEAGGDRHLFTQQKKQTSV